jgi:uncharacterized protein YjbJ (UPF0337 family)
MSLKDKAREVEDTVKNVGRKVKQGFGALTGRTQVRKIGRMLKRSR